MAVARGGKNCGRAIGSCGFVTFVTFTNTLFRLKGTIPVAQKAD